MQKVGQGAAPFKYIHCIYNAAICLHQPLPVTKDGNWLF